MKRRGGIKKLSKRLSAAKAARRDEKIAARVEERFRPKVAEKSGGQRAKKRSRAKVVEKS